MQPYLIVPATGSNPADEWLRLGVEAHAGNRLADAQRHYLQALRLDPRHAVATMNLGIVYAQSPGLLNEGLLAIERAEMFDGVTPMAATNRALMCLEAERIDEALAAARRAVALAKPDASGNHARLAVAMAAATAGHPDEAVAAYEAILESEPAHPMAGTNACFVRTLTESTPAQMLTQRQKWHATHGYKGERKPLRVDRDPDRTLRVGYVGGDFKMHSAAMIFGQVVLRHDRTRVDPYLYCSLPTDPKADGQTKRFVDCGHWRDIEKLTDEQADDLIRQDKIDILVDVAAHTSGGRLGVFTRKPAPLQVTAWGFAHGTGCPEIDYFLACPVSVPEGEKQFYAEKIFYLPSIVTYDPPPYDLKGTSTAPYFANDYFTFGSYARYEKLSDDCLKTFAEILRRVPDAKLQFKDAGFRRPYSIKRVLSFMEGVAPERLLFSINTSHPDHLLAHQQCDLALDPFPHGGGVVALEQLHMGVPVLTLRGNKPAGRSAASVLTAMGRGDWVAGTKEEYVDKAVALAADAPKLAKARKTLRQELLDSPAVKGYRESVEQCFRQIWREWCEK